MAACLDAGAAIVEIDLVPLADGDFALLHDGHLDATTDGSGSVAEATAEQVREFRLRWRGALTDEPVGTLSEAVALVAAHDGLAELQLDLKPFTPLTDAVLAALLRQIAPIRPRVRVTSVADWALRRLRRLDPGLALGFDPLLYLDVERGSPTGDASPRTTPAPTATWTTIRWRLIGGARRMNIWRCAPRYWPRRHRPARGTCRATLLARMLADGFDWIDWLHRHSIQVAAWTLNPDQPHHIALARRLSALGVDRITTDDPAGLAAVLDRACA